jgi:hypothetical protein
MGMQLENYAYVASSTLPAHRYTAAPLISIYWCRSCGTAKAISGHTHMNSFYVLYCIRSLSADGCAHRVASSTTEATMQTDTDSLKADRSDVRGGREEETSRIAAVGDAPYGRYGRGALCLAMVLWILFTMQTYFAGYHTLRHMIYGAGAGTITLLVFDDLSDWVSLWLTLASNGGWREGTPGDARLHR